MDALLTIWNSLLGATGTVGAAAGGVLASNTKTMDMAQLMAMAAALGWASGIRLYLVVFITGMAGMLGWLPCHLVCTCCSTQPC